MTEARGRLGRYWAYQLADYARERGVPTVLVGGLLILFGLVTVGRLTEQSALESGVPNMAVVGLVTLLQIFAPIGTLFAINGIISNDRKDGYFRFLFAKPISAPRYYAQAFAANFVGLLLATLLFLGAYAAAVFPIFTVGSLAFVALYFLVYGGLGFLISALTRYDWMVLSLVWGLGVVLRSMIPAEESWYGRTLDIVLPPSTELLSLAGDLVRGEVAELAPLTHIIAYGAVAFLAGLIVVRLRPMAA